MQTEVIRQRIQSNLYRIQKGQKIAVYPYGETGRDTRAVLEEYGVQPTYIVDNYSKELGIMNFDTFMKYYDENTVILFTIESRAIFLKLMEQMLLAGIRAQNIVVMQMIQLVSYEALEKIINDKKHVSVLDIGCGQGIQGRFMSDYGKEVTGITISDEDGYDGRCWKNVIKADFLTVELEQKYDIVWASHILEHIMDVEGFLRKMKEAVAPGGCLALTVPRENSILLPHIHSFSAGRLLRYMLCAGYDCRNAQILEYGYNISIILPEVRYIEREFNVDGFVDESANATGADDLFLYLPKEIKLSKSWDNIYYFNGNIYELNWDKSNHKIFL